MNLTYPQFSAPLPRRLSCIAVLSLLALTSNAGAQSFTPLNVPDFAAHVSFSLGVSWVDVDGDNDLDLFVVTGFAPNNDNVLFRNDGNDMFHRVTGVPLTMDAAESACSTWGDYDNDGDVDGFVSNLVNRGGLLYEGHGGTDLTLNESAGITEAARKGTGAAWGDYDNDGQLDLVIAALYGQGGIATGNRLFHNNGDGTFEEIQTGPQVTTLDSHHHPTWSDYDADGDLDLFFGTGGPGFVKQDRMYRNLLRESGTATFEAITAGPIATDLRDSQVLSWVDYDNDGDLDLYAVNYSNGPNQLYRNDAGVFTKILAGAIVTDAGAAHGVVWGDFDNDGDQDAYVVRDSRQANRFYRNEGDGTFTSILTGAFVNDALSQYGAAGGDYDRDGDLDLFVPTARREGPGVLYRNDLASGANWLTVRCQGTLSNRSGIGAKVRVRAMIGGQPRWQLREILAGTSYGGHNALEAHFGLADAPWADSLVIEWPSGLVERFTNVPGRQLLTTVENASTPILGEVESSVATSSGVRLTWLIPGPEGRLGAVERRESEVPWEVVGRIAVGARGRVEFSDPSVQPGRRYGYRVNLAIAERETPMGEIWIDVPASIGLRLSPVWPNPGPGRIDLDLDLTDDAPATLAIYDVSGRHRFTRPIAMPAAGHRRLQLVFGRSLGDGVYYARLRQGQRASTARIVVAG